MSRLADCLSKSSVFKSFFTGNQSAIAIKDDSQVFVSFQNVIKAVNIHSQNASIVVNADSAKFIVNQLVLNKDSSLLASVGSHDICVYDVQLNPDFQGKNLFPLRLFAGSLKTTTSIKSVLWHPASGLNSELVILTQDKILLYDLVMSKNVPVLTIDFKNYPVLKEAGVLSIAFGSSAHFAGSMTLYLSTSTGDIYAIYPFLYLGSKISGTKAAASRFVSEWDATMDSIDGILPDSGDFEEARHPLNHQANFVGSIRLQLEDSLRLEALGSQVFSWSPNFHVIDYKLAGPLASMGPNAKILGVCSNDKFSILAAFLSESGKTTIKTYAQINPIVLSFNTASLQEPLPEAPPLAPKPERIVYKKLNKGFGYQEVLDSTSASNMLQYKAEMKVYKAKLFAHKIKSAYFQFACENFNNLTLLTNDCLQFPFDGSLANSLKLIENSIFTLRNGDKLLIGDASNLSQKIQFESEVNLEIEYKQKNLSLDSKGNGYDFAYIDDVIEGTGGYVVALSPSSAVSVIQLRPKPPTIDPLVIMPKHSVPKEGLISSELGSLNADALPAEDLRLIYSGLNAEESSRTIDPNNCVKSVYNISSDFLKDLAKHNQYFLAVQIKLGLQVDNLKSQIKILSELSSSQDDSGVYGERISKVSKRQEMLLKRLGDMRLLIIEKFETCKSKQSLPLSDEERNWFHELNAITKKLNVGDEQNPSLNSSVESLKEKVRKVSNNDKKQSEDDEIANSLSKLRLGVSLYNINNILGQELKRVKEIKDTIEGLIIKVHDAGLRT